MSAVITETGLYGDIPEGEYHADPCAPELGRSLSVSGAKLLLPPNCPAMFEHVRKTGPVTKDAFDFGHAAHEFVLGVGQGIVSIDADDWKTKAAREAKAAAHAEGKTPLLAKDVAKAKAMADVVRAHPLAAAILTDGEPEMSMFWTDTETGVTRRGRIDWLRPNAIVDFKTTLAGGANPAKFAKTAADLGYHMQDDWYRAGIAALDLGDLPFLFIVQEKVPPYLVSVIQLDDEARQIGARLNRQALDTYAECEAADVWPAYCDDIETVSLPRYYSATH